MHKHQDLTPEEVDRVIEMAWEDRTPFEAIELQVGLKEKEVVKLMRREMKRSSFTMWRKRVSGRKTKHSRKRSPRVERFKAPDQKRISY
ncbi:TIGR03643 family protein [Bacillus daqingensis]|uniref:TIGR03643 family protein n=1 Tax=Bacillus daqingensis TaxID=872396 RepID=A0ABV9NXC0_9BACI